VPFIFIDYIGSILKTKSIKLQFVGNEEMLCFRAVVEKEYERGIKIPDEEFRNLSIEFNDELPRFNYTITPRENVI
jgi:hypothetical protein